MAKIKRRTLEEIVSSTAQLGYNWVALDKFGTLFAFREEPVVNEHTGGWTSSYNKVIRLYAVPYHNEDKWYDTLTEFTDVEDVE